MAKKNKYSYKTIRRSGTRYMICRNSNPNNKYFNGVICENYELVSDTTVAVLCSCCTRKISAPPEISKGYQSKGMIRGWQFICKR
jgi:ribosomal protein L36